MHVYMYPCRIMAILTIIGTVVVVCLGAGSTYDPWAGFKKIGYN